MTIPSPSVDPYAPTEVAPAGPNSLARASFVIAIVLVAVAAVMQVVNVFIPVIMYNLALDGSAIGVFFGVLAFFNLLLGGLGLVLGLMGARRRDSVLQAGIGIGVGGFVAITSLISVLAPPLAYLLA